MMLVRNSVPKRFTFDATIGSKMLVNTLQLFFGPLLNSPGIIPNAIQICKFNK